MLPAKLPSKQLQVIWYSVINSIIHQWWSGKCYGLLPKYLYLTCTWLKKYLMYLISSKYSEYLNLYLYLLIWKSTCTWLKYFEKYLTPTLLPSTVRVLLCVSAVFCIIQALVIKLITFPKFIRLPIFAFLHLFRINSNRPRHLHGKLHVGAERQQANWVAVYTRSASLSRNLWPALT